MESSDREIIFGFLRLRFTENPILPILKGCALIQELHVYGPVKEVYGISDYKSSQHYGFGKKLMKHAEFLSIINGYYKVSVISGIGVRDYYRKLGYELKETFMIKTLIDIPIFLAFFFLIVALIYNFIM